MDIAVKNILPAVAMKSIIAIIGPLNRDFAGIFFSRANFQATNRLFSVQRYLEDLRSGENDRLILEESAKRLKSVAENAVKESLRDHFLNELPMVGYVQERLNALSSGMGNLFLNTFSGAEEREQISSPFHLEEGLPLEDYGLSNHRFSYGLRPFRIDNPYIFFGHTLGKANNRILAVQARIYLNDWANPGGELAGKISVGKWSFGGGLKIKRQSGNSEEKPFNVASFVGIRGPVLGGNLFIGTAYYSGFGLIFNRQF